jgi:cytochrome c biogenesis protein ResB
MTRILSLLWHKLGSIQLTVVVCFLLIADLVIGYFCLDKHAIIFQPLNDVGLYQWAKTYGRHNIAYTGWFFALLPLLAVFAINTFVCTTDRVIALIKSRLMLAHPFRFALRFSPHIMHYALIVILVGYLGSYLLADVYPSRTLIPGGSMTIPNSRIQIKFVSFKPEHYKGSRLAFFANSVIRPNIRLILSDGIKEKVATIAYNRPVTFQGYGVFLKDFSPKAKMSMSPRVHINISVRKDPGVTLYFTGIIIFIVGLVMYISHWLVMKKESGAIP